MPRLRLSYNVRSSLFCFTKVMSLAELCGIFVLSYHRVGPMCVLLFVFCFWRLAIVCVGVVSLPCRWLHFLSTCRLHDWRSSMAFMSAWPLWTFVMGLIRHPTDTVCWMFCLELHFLWTCLPACMICWCLGCRLWLCCVWTWDVRYPNHENDVFFWWSQILSSSWSLAHGDSDKALIFGALPWTLSESPNHGRTYIILHLLD